MASSWTPNSVLEIGARKFATNIKKGVNVKYKWNISNFDTSIRKFESPMFTNGRDVEWRMNLQKSPDRCNHLLAKMIHLQSTPLGDQICSCRYKEEIYYYLKLVLTSDATKVQYNCKFQLLNTIPDNTKTWRKHIPFKLGRSLDCFEMNMIDVLNVSNGFLQDGIFTLTCEINAVIEISLPHTVPKCTLRDDMEVIFENKEFTDFTFYVSGKEFQVHKAILAARSPVFKAMFKHNMKKSKNNRVELSEVKEEVFRELLRFVYTGKVLNLNDIAMDLLQVAIRYRLENLKVLCIQELSRNISVENSVEVLILANLHSLDQLKTLAMGYIGNHFSDVIKTDGWRNMKFSNEQLLSEVFRTNGSIQFE